jgi:hypothetical protein
LRRGLWGRTKSFDFSGVWTPYNRVDAGGTFDLRFDFLILSECMIFTTVCSLGCSAQCTYSSFEIACLFFLIHTQKSSYLSKHNTYSYLHVVFHIQRSISRQPWVSTPGTKVPRGYGSVALFACNTLSTQCALRSIQ